MDGQMVTGSGKKDYTKYAISVGIKLAYNNITLMPGIILIIILTKTFVTGNKNNPENSKTFHPSDSP